ncbi:MAG: ComEA family DNA-binding protein [Chloroflexi bacterium]|jgi:comEA protein|nr:ComEA family DNA-binding protein [Chloroflexota bacterium]
MSQDENHPIPPIAERLDALTAPDEDQPAREEIERQVRIQYRGYLVLATVIALIVGGVIGHFTPGEANPLSETQLTPPPYWGQVCVTREATDDEDAPEGVAVPPTATPQPLRVYVSGAVAAPDVVVLPPDSLLADALKAVGGPTDAADMSAINLAAPLSDHQHVIVPERASAEAAPEPEAPATNPTTGEKIDLNQATAAELETLPNIGPALAERILDYRAEHGPFPTTEALMEVSGIGPTTYEEIAPRITVTTDGD